MLFKVGALGRELDVQLSARDFDFLRASSLTSRIDRNGELVYQLRRKYLTASGPKEFPFLRVSHVPSFFFPRLDIPQKIAWPAPIDPEANFQAKGALLYKPTAAQLELILGERAMKSLDDTNAFVYTIGPVSAYVEMEAHAKQENSRWRYTD